MKIGSKIIHKGGHLNSLGINLGIKQCMSYVLFVIIGRTVADSKSCTEVLSEGSKEWHWGACTSSTP